MDTDVDKRAQFDAGRAAGKSVKDLIAELQIPKSTAYQWNSAAKDAANETAPPDSVPPPEVKATKGSSKRGGSRGGRMSVRPISEDTAATLLSGIFFIPAMMQSEPEWMLTEAQKQMLAGPFADSLRVMPAPIADAVNTYSAPGVFLTSLAAVVTQKANRIAYKRAMVKRGFRVPPANGAPPPAPPAEGTAPIAEDVPPPQAPPPAVDSDLASAMAAAKGSLTEQDETPTGTEAFA